MTSTQPHSRPLAVVTGASSGIGIELAKLCAANGFDLVLAADEPLDHASHAVRELGANVETAVVDLATRPGVETLVKTSGIARCRHCSPMPATGSDRRSSISSSRR